jgi:hypothetical protein
MPVGKFTWGRAEYLLDERPWIKHEIGEVEDHPVRKVVQEYQDLFSEEGTLRESSLPGIQIETEPGRVVNCKPYRTSLNKRHIVDTEIDNMLKMGIIRPSNSEWASGITLVPKKDGTTRFCVDYRRLNSVTVKDRYPLPHIQDIFDSLGGANVFSTLDLKSGYWQLPVHGDSIKKMAFTCHRGLFEFLRMPFGLANAPSFLQRAMTQALSEFIGKFCMVFNDDIVVYSRSEEEHAEHLRLIFDAFAAAGLTLKEGKCEFLKESLDLLGFRISKEGVTVQQEKVAAIQKMPRP